MAAYYWKDEKVASLILQEPRSLVPDRKRSLGLLPGDTLANAKTLIDKVNREDIWKEAAKEAGIAAADIPQVHPWRWRIFDGIKFDPNNPTAYLKSLKIKKVEFRFDQAVSKSFDC